ncbi:hypothetical protein TURU_144543 [Turdus rufiventris]|nr:hypothetical protein TURU_144543 [Turdus rufiventris]
MGWDGIQRDSDKLKKWTHGNLMKFNKTKCKVLHLGLSNPPYQPMLGDEQIQSSPAQKDLGVLGEERLDMTQPCALTAQKPNVSWTASKAAWTSGEGGDSAPLLSFYEILAGVLHPVP